VALLEAMRRTRLQGIAKLVLRDREKVALMRPGRTGITVHTLLFANQVRELGEFRANTESVDDREITACAHAIKRMYMRFELEPDPYQARFAAMIEKKMAAAPEKKAGKRSKAA
jgi:non-homologous end joining protein Ku